MFNLHYMKLNRVCPIETRRSWVQSLPSSVAYVYDNNIPTEENNSEENITSFVLEETLRTHNIKYLRYPHIAFCQRNRMILGTKLRTKTLRTHNSNYVQCIKMKLKSKKSNIRQLSLIITYRN